MSKIFYNTIDLFAGCGGLMEGFEQSGHYKTVAAVEWEPIPCLNLKKRLASKWHYENSDKMVLCFDIQRTDELFNGWNDEKYSSSVGLDKIVNEANGIDIIIGGPPCQAYSIAGRVRDSNGMRTDYRNYLFESYLKVVKRYKPKLFVFENVPGILSAKPNGVPIIDVIRDSFNEIGYNTLFDLKKAIIDFTQYGIPQNRKRIIILGINKNYFGSAKAIEMTENFYINFLPKYRTETKSTVFDAISDLPKLYPLKFEQNFNGKKLSHSLPSPFVANHIPRWHNSRDIETFKILTEDIENGINKYTSIDALKKLYTERTGKISNIHKYHVLRWNEPSNLIPAHLYKDGLRHIHPDSNQARTITVREAARLQTFPDDYIFEGSNVELYKMIGNAVPPLFSKLLANAIFDLLYEYDNF